MFDNLQDLMHDYLKLLILSKTINGMPQGGYAVCISALSVSY